MPKSKINSKVPHSIYEIRKLMATSGTTGSNIMLKLLRNYRTQNNSTVHILNVKGLSKNHPVLKSQNYGDVWNSFQFTNRI